MATNFPSSLDALTNPTGSSALTSPDHATQHADANDAIEALQSKVGVNGSAVATSIDYRTNQLESGNFADTSLTIQPIETNLGTVTNVVSNVGSTIAEIAVNGVYYLVTYPESAEIYTSDALSVTNVLNTLNVGDRIFFYLGYGGNYSGSWEYSSYSASGSEVNIYFVPGSVDGNWSSFEVYYDSGDKFYLPNTSTVTTDNPSLSLSEQYFHIGDNAVLSANATVSGANINLSEDLSALFSVGDQVKEFSYTTEPTLSSYNSDTGETLTRPIRSILQGYRYIETIDYYSSGTFIKADYPEAKLIRVIGVSGGGGSGGIAATGTGQVSLSGGGGAGALIVAWFDVENLVASVPVIVGAGGAAGASNPLGSGGVGGQTQFWGNGLYAATTYFQCSGGQNSFLGSAVGAPATAVSGGSGSLSRDVGSLLREEEFWVLSGTSRWSWAASASFVCAGGGAGGYKGYSGGDVPTVNSTATGIDGSVFLSYGGGGGGKANCQNLNAAQGRQGKAGMLRIEVYG
jgi:hypothetical protein